MFWFMKDNADRDRALSQEVRQRLFQTGLIVVTCHDSSSCSLVLLSHVAAWPAIVTHDLLSHEALPLLLRGLRWFSAYLSCVAPAPGPQRVSPGRAWAG